MRSALAAPALGVSSIMKFCRLCQSLKDLCRSHIVPEFLYKDLYNDERKLMGITGVGNKGWKPLQKGLREKLLCNDCEQFINNNYEIPFRKQWYESNVIPNKMDGPHAQIYDYQSFKLFHLSIIYRASVSSLPTFNQVSLGKHENVIRGMLINQDPGEENLYPIVGYSVLNNQKEVERRLITRPQITKIDGHRVYSSIYGGVMWWVVISSHKCSAFSEIQLKQSGEITFIPVPWHEIGLMQQAKEALNNVSY